MTYNQPPAKTEGLHANWYICETCSRPVDIPRNGKPVFCAYCDQWVNAVVECENGANEDGK